MSLAFTSIIKMMGKKAFVKSAEVLKGAVEKVNDAATSGGAASLISLLNKFTNVGVALEPFQIVLNSIKADTTKASMEVFKEVMKLVKSDEMKAGTEAFSDVLNMFIEDTFVSTLKSLNSILDKTSDGSLSDVIDAMVKFSIYIIDHNPNIFSLIKGIESLIDTFQNFDLDEYLQSVKQSFIDNLGPIFEFLGFQFDTLNDKIAQYNKQSYGGEQFIDNERLGDYNPPNPDDWSQAGGSTGEGYHSI